MDLKLYSRFVHRLFDHGVYLTHSNGLHWIISTARTDADVQALVKAADKARLRLS